MAEFEKKTKRYPTDLTDEEWARIEPFVPAAAKSGRPARTDLGEVLNAIRTIEIIRRSDTAQGFEVLPRRWVVERTFGWMTPVAPARAGLRGAHDRSQAIIHVASEVSSSDASLTNRRSQTDSKLASQAARPPLELFDAPSHRQ
jgi:transposase